MCVCIHIYIYNDACALYTVGCLGARCGKRVRAAGGATDPRRQQVRRGGQRLPQRAFRAAGPVQESPRDGP